MALIKSKETEQLKARVAELEALITPEVYESAALSEKIAAQRQALNVIEAQLAQARADHSNLMHIHSSELSAIQSQIAWAQSQYLELNDAVLMQSFGLYQPHYDFTNSTGYKEALESVRAAQKQSVRSGTATTGSPYGGRTIADLQKLILRAFNLECDDVISRAKFNNMAVCEKQILAAFSAISKLGSSHGVAITGTYRNLKLQELYLAHEYQVEKQQERERLKQLRADERERAKLEKELEEARRKIQKEQNHYSNELVKVIRQLRTATYEEIPALEEKRTKIVEHLNELEHSMEQVDYRAANEKAGYVYIISNVGAFGEGVYKIGMTRRLDPMDRVDELGDASVPFNFDVHAMIFSENAPALEAALHRAFEDRKLNMINTRREFFRVSLDEIKAVVKANYDKTVEFVDVPPADQFRQSELMRPGRV